jgi:hypothetical protein
MDTLDVIKSCMLRVENPLIGFVGSINRFGCLTLKINGFLIFWDIVADISGDILIFSVI